MEKRSRTKPRYSGSYVFLTALYFPLACGMYYFNNEYMNLGGIHFMYKFVLAGALAGLSFVVFLVRTDLKRAGRLLRSLVLLSLPHLVMILASVPLWVFRMQRLTQIRRGLFDQVYGLFILLAMGGILYVFGRRGLWLNLAAMVGANFITAMRVILENGVSVYFHELVTLITSFAGETGEVIQQMEIHELTFALGVYLIFGILNWKEVRQQRGTVVLLVLSAFCFFSGFKRIGVVAIAAALLAWAVLRPLSRRRSSPAWLLMGAFALTAAAFLYICLVKNGIFEFLSSRFGLDTMGRRELSQFIDQYYWIAPNFFGNGAGFVTRLFSDLPAEWTIRALHNDILAIYIDAGFWGFWAWMLCFFPLRVWVVYRWHGQRSALLCLCLEAYILVTAATDNTIYYIYVTGAMAICLMSGWLREWEAEDAGTERILH